MAEENAAPPAPVTTHLPETPNNGVTEPESRLPMPAFLSGFSQLTWLKQAGLMVALAACVAVGVVVALWTQEEDFRPLYGSLERLDMGEVVEILEYNQLDFKIEPNSGALLVAKDDLHKARLKLAEAGLPNETAQGFELLDQKQPLGTSQFMEAARYKRSLEGELARTITSIHSVRSARVHLAIPKESVFVRQSRQPSASVLLELFAGRQISPVQVKAIANLVASSIPQLEPKQVTVVDQKGNLLSTQEKASRYLQAERQREFARKLEGELIERVESLLAPIVGRERVKTEIAADVDFTEQEQAIENYNHDPKAVRSEHTIDEKKVGSGSHGGIPGALSNQPPGTAIAPEQFANNNDNNALPTQQRSQATRNFELDRTLSYTRRQQGTIQRLSVAVVIDHKLQVNQETGDTEWAPWTEDEIQRFTLLVRDAVGYSSARGDSVSVVNTRFLPDQTVETHSGFWASPWADSLMSYGLKPLLGFLFFLALLFGVIRPVLSNLSSNAPVKKDEETPLEPELMDENTDGDNIKNVQSPPVDKELRFIEPIETTYEQQLDAVKALIGQDAGRVAMVVRSWINEEQ